MYANVISVPIHRQYFELKSNYYVELFSAIIKQKYKIQGLILKTRAATGIASAKVDKGEGGRGGLRWWQLCPDSCHDSGDALDSDFGCLATNPVRSLLRRHTFTSVYLLSLSHFRGVFFVCSYTRLLVPYL